MGRYKFRNAELKKLLVKYNGNVSDIAKHLGVSRGAVYNRINKYPDLEKLKYEQDESLLDKAEKKMFELAEEGNITALIFTLKTKGRHRGWAEKQEMHIQAQVEAKTGGVRTPAEDAKYLGEVIKELRNMGLSSPDEPPTEVVDGEVYELHPPDPKPKEITDGENDK